MARRCEDLIDEYDASHPISKKEKKAALRETVDSAAESEDSTPTLEHYWQFYCASYWHYIPVFFLLAKILPVPHITGKTDYCPVTGVPVLVKNTLLASQ